MTQIDANQTNPWAATLNQVLKFNGTEYAPADESGGGGTGLVLSFNLPYSDHTMQAWETILEGQHTSTGTYQWVSIDVNTDNLKTYSSPATINFGQCFIWEVAWNLTTLTTKWDGINYGSSNVRIDWSTTAKIYAITGTYGVDSTKTWPALYTSDVVPWSLYNQLAYMWYASFDTTHTFNDTIQPGTYVVMIEWNLSTAFGSWWEIRIKWDAAWAAYAGNVVDDTTPVADQNIYGVFSSDEVLVYVSNATNALLSNWQWLATETKNIWETISLQLTWEIDQSWADDDWALWYLSDTPGELSLTPWTNVRIIAQWSDVDKARMWRDNYDTETITRNTTYYTNTWWVAGGAFSITYSWINVWWYVIISVSDDNITRKQVSKDWRIDGGWWDNSPAWQAIISAKQYFKVEYNPSWPWSWISSYTDHWAYFRPIK